MGKAFSRRRPDQFELDQFIPLHCHCHMLPDGSRMAGFKEAISHVLKPGASFAALRPEMFSCR